MTDVTFVSDCGEFISADTLIDRGLAPEFALVVGRLGFMAVRASRAGARVWFNPAVAAPRAIAAVRDRLTWLKPPRTVLTTVGKPGKAGESDRIVFGWEAACLEIADAVTVARFSRPDAFLARPLDGWALEALPALAGLRRLWDGRSTSTAQFLEDAQRVVDSEPGSRMVVVECNLANGSSIICQLRGPFPAFDDKWVRMSAGLRVQDQVDYAYGQWISGTYARVAASGAAVIDDVDVEVKHPRFGLVRSRYRRLILPLAGDRPDRVTLVSANVIDPTIDLRSA